MFTIGVNEAITLQVLSARDAAPLFAMTDRSRDYLQKWLPWLDDTKTVDDSMAFIKNALYLYNRRTGVTMGVFYRNELVGIVGYNRLDFKNKIGSIGYWLDINHQGKGIMTEAVRAIIDYGFDRLKLNRVEIRVADENYPSRAIAERLDFQYEGRIRQAEWLYDHYVDHILYGLLKKEWHTNRD